jgi:hypothetical protein
VTFSERPLAGHLPADQRDGDYARRIELVGETADREGVKPNAGGWP